jgi:hypothetical protein
MPLPRFSGWLGALAIGVLLTGCGSLARPFAAAGGLDGLYFQMKFAFGNYEPDHWVFTANGKYFHGLPPGGLEHFDIDAGIRAAPGKGGTYAIEGPSLILTPAQGAAAKRKFENAGGTLKLDGTLLSKAAKFDRGATLDARYSWSGSAGAGTSASVSAGVSYAFTSQGTFTGSRVAGVAVSAGGQSQGAASGGETSGTYALAGNTLTLTHKGGQVTRHTVFPYDMGDPKPWLSIDGRLCRPR